MKKDNFGTLDSALGPRPEYVVLVITLQEKAALATLPILLSYKGKTLLLAASGFQSCFLFLLYRPDILL